MTTYPRALWDRAVKALDVARKNLQIDPDTAASRAYYAAFYAVSAVFCLAGKTYTRHTAVEAAVHRDLVHAGLWPKELGTAYSRLMQIRSRGDYGGARHVSLEDAQEATRLAADILKAVGKANPSLFGELFDA